ncbi:hypothetical protein CC1G_00103 [Coprinopsis cinerea okayama7|uniref:Peptidase S54 rhomboid domain-containing protein n=1 Tax=Coprinopsis cinerea (strain Okayama-7 / 130 / ATCC MYA-4618 / FGSC 9003) TaxID=240176 RepID=A8NWR6_COPC7|nr:hypothetical protein CC1G_00103 [Coprinopsis cinerea okayama7\|eukprot:XP_001836967.2 hypothetical protein CC1G_00103 [Coprinopsis cinerea okayama7\
MSFLHRTLFRQSCLMRNTANSRSFLTSTKQSLRYHPSRGWNPPPKRGYLDFLDRIPQKTVMYGILGVNGLVFGAWYMSQQKYKYERDPSAYLWMHQHFTSSWQNLRQGRYWTLLTSCFSHQDMAHIFFNGFTFFFTAPVVLQMIGSKRFIFLYMGCGLVSSAASLLYARYVDKRDRPSLGASGAIYSVTSFLACAAPTLSFYIYGIIPVPAWLLVSGIFAWDAYKTVQDKRGTVDTIGHLGGLAAGAASYIVLRRSMGRPLY